GIRGGEVCFGVVDAIGFENTRRHGRDQCSGGGVGGPFGGEHDTPPGDAGIAQAVSRDGSGSGRDGRLGGGCLATGGGKSLGKDGGEVGIHRDIITVFDSLL